MSFIMSNPRFQAFDANGVPLSGGKLYTYASGTTTPKTTYSDQGLTTPNTNPVVLDSRGEATIWGSGEYKLKLADSNDVQLWIMDEVQWYDLSSVIPTYPLSIANGGTAASTAAAARTSLDAQEDVITNRGDLVSGNSSGVASRLGLGLNKQFLRSDGTDAVWESVASASSVITTQGDLIIGDVSGDESRLAIGTVGKILKSTGSTAEWSTFTGSDFYLWNKETFSTGVSGTVFTVPAGVTQIIAEVMAAGGGGGGALVGSNSSAGGGGGAFVRALISGLTPGATITVTVGSAGVGGNSSPTNGTAGGSSSFGSYVVCDGGVGGGSSTNDFGGGSGRYSLSGSNVFLLEYTALSGESSGSIISSAATGRGGDSKLGLGGNYRTTVGDGLDASGYGSGGSGARSGPSGGQAGGDGADGIVYIYYQ